MGWADWINVGGTVLDVASQISNLLGDKDDAANPVMQGTVQFTTDDAGNTYAQNMDPDYGVTLTYSATQQSGQQISTVSQVQCLAPTQNPPPNSVNIYNCTQDLSNYASGGFLSISGVANEDGGAVTSALSFALRCVAIGATIAIIGGITAQFGIDPNTGYYQITIQSTGPTLQSATVSVTGQNGGTFSGNMTFSSPSGSGSDLRVADGTFGSIDLPPGMNIDPLIAELDIILEIDSDSFRKLIGM